VVIGDSQSAQERFHQDAPLHRFIEDIKREVVTKYIAKHMAILFAEELEDSAIVTQRDNHFVMLLPETRREDVTAIANRLQAAASRLLGLKLNVGASTFPDEAVTFETLLERAEAEMINVESATQMEPGAVSIQSLESGKQPDRLNGQSVEDVVASPKER
jgi:GGDEF domain-containing protein